METVAIFGVGLIGGSFALALKKEGFRGRIVGVSSPATLERAFAAGAIDEALPAEDAARTANLIYLAQPISTILSTIPALNEWVRPDALVTDAGSTKGTIVARANESLIRCLFIGGHPLAGKERRGVEHADPDLFRGLDLCADAGRPAGSGSPLSRQFPELARSHRRQTFDNNPPAPRRGGCLYLAFATTYRDRAGRMPRL